MKRISTLIVLLSLAVSFNLYAQKRYEKSIENGFSAYFKNISEKKSREAISYIDQDFFEIVPEHELIKSLEVLNENEKFNYNISKAKIDKYYDLIQVNDNYYLVFDYSTQVSLKFNDTELSVQKKEDYIQQFFGKENPNLNLNYNKITDNYLFTESKKLCAISKDNKRTWKFILVDTNNNDYLSKVLPEKVIETL